MSFKDQIVKKTLERRQEIERQKTNYEELYNALDLEKRIDQEADRGESHLRIPGSMYLDVGGLKGCINMVQLVCDDKFIAFIQGKLEGFEVFKDSRNGTDLLIRWSSTQLASLLLKLADAFM